MSVFFVVSPIPTTKKGAIPLCISLTGFLPSLIIPSVIISEPTRF